MGLKGSIQFQSPTVQWGTVPLGDVFLFFDEGRADVLSPLPSEPVSTVLRSTGAGLHLLPGKPINGVFTWADPLRDGPNTRHGDSRFLFVVRGSF
jgi:hypothetical protein